MDQIVHYASCPICGASGLKKVFDVKDYLVSQLSFPIVECQNCTARITQDVPSAGHIGDYYKSEQYVSHSNSKKGLINFLYHQVRKITLVQKRKWVEYYTKRKQGRLLDIGAGTGAFAAEMKKNAWEVTGLEPDEDARRVANTDFQISLSEMQELFQLPTGHFNAITLWHVLEHVHDLNGYMQRIKSLLTSEGRLFIAVPNYLSMDAQQFGAYWAAYDVPRHLYHFSPKSMQVLSAAHGMEVEAQITMPFDSFYVAMLSNQHKSQSSKLISSLFTGLRSNAQAKKNGASSVCYVVRKVESLGV